MCCAGSARSRFRLAVFSRCVDVRGQVGVGVGGGGHGPSRRAYDVGTAPEGARSRAGPAAWLRRDRGVPSRQMLACLFDLGRRPLKERRRPGAVPGSRSRGGMPLIEWPWPGRRRDGGATESEAGWPGWQLGHREGVVPRPSRGHGGGNSGGAVPRPPGIASSPAGRAGRGRGTCAPGSACRGRSSRRQRRWRPWGVGGGRVGGPVGPDSAAGQFGSTVFPQDDRALTELGGPIAPGPGRPRQPRPRRSCTPVPVAPWGPVDPGPSGLNPLDALTPRPLGPAARPPPPPWETCVQTTPLSTQMPALAPLSTT